MPTLIYAKHNEIFMRVVQRPGPSVPWSHDTCHGDQQNVYLITGLIIGKLKALQSTKICTQCCRDAAPDKFELIDNTDL